MPKYSNKIFDRITGMDNIIYNIISDGKQFLFILFELE